MQMKTTAPALVHPPHCS